MFLPINPAWTVLKYQTRNTVFFLGGGGGGGASIQHSAFMYKIENYCRVTLNLILSPMQVNFLCTHKNCFPSIKSMHVGSNPELRHALA